jgi:hypothetical protein
MEGDKIFCEHFNDKNITKSVAGKKKYIVINVPNVTMILVVSTV